VVLATAIAMAGLAQLPAHADDTVVVHGTAFPNPRAAQLTLVGCDTLYGRSTEFLQPYISRHTRLGTRSLKYDLAGGNALGTLSYVDSMRDTTTAGLQYHAHPGAQGVAYAGFQRPDAEGYELWIGRAPLTAGGGWESVDAAALTYTWAEFDMQTGQPTGRTAETPATVAAFAAANGGDGAGFYMVGWGCDGEPFYMDGWRIGAPGSVTTYDIEALTTKLTIGGSTHAVDAGKPVTLTGTLRDGTGRRLVRGTMILEARPVSGGPFRTVDVVDASSGDPSVTVTPDRPTVYRWRFADRPLATGSVSPEFRVDVRQPRREQPGTDAPSNPAPSTSAPSTSTPPAPPKSSTSPDPGPDPAPSSDPTADGPTQAPDGEPTDASDDGTPAPEVTVTPSVTP